jgi:outer membrane protein OmpA-like peptidoglycan-associated protein/Tol biopolymer transport system component/Tfp pilus assembly protein PilF
MCKDKIIMRIYLSFFLKLWLISALIFLLSPSIMSQMVTRENLTKKENTLLEKAIKESKRKDYDKSIKSFKKLLKAQPDFMEGRMRLATVFLNIRDLEKAEKMIEAVVNQVPDFDPEVYYTLAQVKNQMKKYEEAGKNYDIYIQKTDPETSKVKKAIKIRDDMYFIHHARQNPRPFEPQNPGDVINTDMSEYFPWLSTDGTQLFFTRYVKTPEQFIGQEDIFVAHKDSLTWGRAEPLTDINTRINEGAFSLSADGKFLVFTVCDKWDSNGGCDLYSSALTNGKWSDVANMGKAVNTAAWDAQPTVSADGRTMIFSSNRLGTLGGSDLWMTYRDQNNSWTIPQNMGAVINSRGNDESPFLHPDGRTLYFRSDGRTGMGGFDIYYTRFTDSTQTWSEPQNLGFPVNTEGDEGALTVSLDGKMAWYATDMNHETGVKQKNLDIYHFELPDEARSIPTTFVKGTVRDAKTQKPLTATVIVKDLSTEDTLYTWQSDVNGNFISPVPSGKNYACVVSKPGYTYYSHNIHLEDIRVLYKPYILNIQLRPVIEENIEDEKPIVLNNIFFKSGSYQLEPESMTEVLLITQMMEENPKIHIILTGHTDNVGKDEDNQILSEKRAQSLAQAIIRKGIEPHRIKTVGAGASQPVSDNNTEEGRQKNRRTEMIILKP